MPEQQYRIPNQELPPSEEVEENPFRIIHAMGARVFQLRHDELLTPGDLSEETYKQAA